MVDVNHKRTVVLVGHAHSGKTSLTESLMYVSGASSRKGDVMQGSSLSDYNMDERERQGQRNLATFMKILMVKRLESSFHAFRLSLDRFTQSYARVITEFKKGNVYISKKHIGKIFGLLEEDDQEGIERLVEHFRATPGGATELLDQMSKFNWDNS